MPRHDCIGMFWQDIKPDRKKGERAPRQLAEIPETGWRPPRYYPNLSAARVLSFDLETYDPELDDHGPGFARGKGHIAGFSLGTEDGYRWYFPIRHTIEPQYNLDPDHSLAYLKDTLSDPKQMKIGANLIYDVGWCRQEGIKVEGELFDVQFAEALLDDRARVNLEALAQKYLGEGKTTNLLQKWIMDSYAPPKDKWRKDIYRTSPRLVGPYGEGDADLPIRLAPILNEELWRHGLAGLFKMECGLINLLVAMRFAGVSVDLDRAEQLRELLEKRAIEKSAELKAYSGVEVNVNAGASVAKAFDKFGIKYPRTAKSKQHPNGQPSFRSEWLKTVDHPLARFIIDIRRCYKLKNTFVEGYVLNGHVNGKLYCSFHPLRGEGGGTIVGRFSSSDPNLQNIPVRDPELGKPIRAIFKKDPGHKQWRHLDYSQIQFRYLVHFAVGPGADEARLRYHQKPETDYHDMVKGMVEDETGQEWDRRPIKNLNFGLAFGMGNAKAGASTGLKDEKLKHFLEAYHKGIPYAKSTMKWIMEVANKTGIVRTILGRMSRFDLYEPDVGFGQDIPTNPVTGKPYPPLPYEDAIRQYGRVRKAMLHTSLARLLQGSEGDTIKSALYRCWTEGVYDYIGVPRLLVHDEVNHSDDGSAQEDAWEYMHHVMETTVKAKVPIIVDADWGPDWGHQEGIPCKECGHKVHRGRTCKDCTCSAPREIFIPKAA